MVCVQSVTAGLVCSTPWHLLAAATRARVLEAVSIAQVCLEW